MPDRERTMGDTMRALRKLTHPNCVVCSPSNAVGLRLDYSVGEGGVVEATFAGNRLVEGYEGIVHGGVIAAVLDGAMVNCLLAREIVAVTAELSIRYTLPIASTHACDVRAWVVSSQGRLHLMEASLHQAGQEAVHAWAKFIER